MQQNLSSWHGSLELVYTYDGDKTQLAHVFAKAPLKVQRPFYPEGNAVCHSVILHTAGGVVGGDRLEQTIQLRPQANALITTAAAGKLYRSNGRLASQTVTIQVEAGARLEWLPQETIVFNGACYQQQLKVDLAPGASWIGWEITRFGRSARGEQYLQGEWRSLTEVWQQERPLWIDRQLLTGDSVDSPHGLAGQPLVGNLIWLGIPVSDPLVTQIRHLWRCQARKGEAGVTLTQERGLLCRYRGSSTAEVRSWFREVWQLLRLTQWQRPGIVPRIWQR